LPQSSPSPVLLFYDRGSSMPRKKHPWYRSRGYLHFDSPVGYVQAKNLVSCQKSVASHSFYPLITYQITTSKIKRCKESGVLIKKEKERPIAFASHLDSHIYSYYSLLLGHLYELAIAKRGIDKSVLAFRALDKSNIDFAADAFERIRQKGNCSAVALDVSGFFDNLNHDYLKRAWRELLGIERLPDDHFAVFKSLTQFSLVDREKLYETIGLSKNNKKKGIFRICTPEEFRSKVRGGGLVQTNKLTKGIPQGTPISALLSNIYMIDFDFLMCKTMNSLGGDYFRYCDDMLFIVPTEERNKIAGFVKQNVQNIHIDINTDKTEIRTFSVDSFGNQTSDKPLQYLGFTFDGQRTLLRSASLARYSDRMKRGVRFAKATMRKRNKCKAIRGEAPTALYTRKLYARYTHLGKCNFLRYGYRAAKIMNSPAIRRQLKPFWARFQQELEK